MADDTDHPPADEPGMATPRAGPTPPFDAVIAVHRFGLGGPASDAGDAPKDWLRMQIGPASPATVPAGATLLDTHAALVMLGERRKARQAARKVAARPGTAMADDDQPTAPSPKASPLRAPGRANLADQQSRLLTALHTSRPFAERLLQFWANHFTVSIRNGQVIGLVGPYEREALRPHVAARFETLLTAAVTHPAMLRYLDNNTSIGPDSPTARALSRRSRRQRERAAHRETAKTDMDGDTAMAQDMSPDMAPRFGLNENLAREILELHTLGVTGGGEAYGPWGGYDQADVTALAQVLTGWRAPDPPRGTETTQFDVKRHQPGAQQVLGRAAPEGREGLPAVLRRLSVHPSTARHVSYKLARHFIADDPPLPLVARMADTWQSSDGDLTRVLSVMIESPESWTAAPAKLKTPEQFVTSAWRTLGMTPSSLPRNAVYAPRQLGQPLYAATSPAGWPDRAESWLAPDAVWKRLEWSQRLAATLPPTLDARVIAAASLGPRLDTVTTRELQRAADGAQALVLLLMSPSFQRC